MRNTSDVRHAMPYVYRVSTALLFSLSCWRSICAADPEITQGVGLRLVPRADGTSVLSWEMKADNQSGESGKDESAARDLQWIANKVREAVVTATPAAATPPQMVPAVVAPSPGTLTKRTYELNYAVCDWKYHYDFINLYRGFMGSFDSKHERIPMGFPRCSNTTDISVSLDVDTPTDLFIQFSGACADCTDSGRNAPKGFGLTLSQVRDDYDRPTKSSTLWQVLDPEVGTMFDFGGGIGPERDEHEQTPYRGGRALRILPVTLGEGKGYRDYESFMAFKEMAASAYVGRVGDIVEWHMPSHNGVVKDEPWALSLRMAGVPGGKYIAVPANIVEVIEGPECLVPWPTLGQGSIGHDSEIVQAMLVNPVTHPVCGLVPWNFRAVVFEYKPPWSEVKSVVLAFKGSTLNRMDWLWTDLPQALGFIPEQYRFSLSVADYVSSRYGGSDYTTVGHSLGGGLAQYVVGSRPRWSGYGFNPAPLGGGCYDHMMRATKGFAVRQRFWCIRNRDDVVSASPGFLLGEIWTLESKVSNVMVLGHTLGSMDLSSVISIEAPDVPNWP